MDCGVFFRLTVYAWRNKFYFMASSNVFYISIVILLRAIDIWGLHLRYYYATRMERTKRNLNVRTLLFRSNIIPSQSKYLRNNTTEA